MFRTLEILGLGKVGGGVVFVFYAVVILGGVEFWGGFRGFV